MSQREHLPQSDQALGEGDPETKETSLKKGTLGLFGIIFFVVAAAAPVAGMTGAFPVAIGIGDGAGAAGMYVAVGIVLLLFSVGYATTSRTPAPSSPTSVAGSASFPVSARLSCRPSPT